MEILDKGSIELVDHLGNDNTIVSAARVSYLGHSKGFEKDRQLIKYLLQNNHTSPFEQVEFQFLVKCPVFVARQWMRHRTWSYNEISRRYTSDNIEFHYPATLRLQDNDDKQSSAGILSDSAGLLKALTVQTEGAYRLYEMFLTAGVCREQARMILPLNVYTSFYAKTDLHNLFHFIELRNSSHAQYEIRVYADAIEKLIEPIVPIAYSEWIALRK